MGRLSQQEFFDDGKIRPRAKAKRDGISSLRHDELLALLLNTGNREENVIEISQRLLYQRGGLKGVFFSSDIMKEKGIKEGKAYRIYALGEIMKRLPLENPSPVKSVQAAFSLTRFYFLNQSEENCLCLFLNQKKEVVSKLIFKSDNKSKVYVSITSILKEAIRSTASFVIILHNHPMGNKSFSNSDIQFSEELFFKLSLVQILLLDSILISEDIPISMRENHIGPYSIKNE